jgi:S-adenosylmethionine decarboxylase proenzyme
VNDNLGHHLLFDCYGCRGATLADLPAVRDVLARAAAAFGLTVIAERLHQYLPQGVSGVLILAESHLAVHTWPEHGFAAVDLFTCGTRLDPAQLADHFKSALNAERVEFRLVERGAALVTAVS